MLMAVLHLNRCKNCNLWRRSDRDHPGPHGRPSRMCHLRLRETLRDGKPVLIQTTDRSVDTTPGPKYRQWTKPGDTCKYFMQKHMQYRRPPPRVEELVEIPAVAMADPCPVVCEDVIPIDRV